MALPFYQPGSGWIKDDNKDKGFGERARANGTRANGKRTPPQSGNGPSPQLPQPSPLMMILKAMQQGGRGAPQQPQPYRPGLPGQGVQANYPVPGDDRT